MPHSQLFGESCSSALSERAALELAVATGVEHIAVCGHSDCKVLKKWVLFYFMKVIYKIAFLLVLIHGLRKVISRRGISDVTHKCDLDYF